MSDKRSLSAVINRRINRRIGSAITWVVAGAIARRITGARALYVITVAVPMAVRPAVVHRLRLHVNRLRTVVNRLWLHINRSRLHIYRLGLCVNWVGVGYTELHTWNANTH